MKESVTQPHRELPPAVMKVVLGNQLARLREEAGVKQEEAAGVLGCTQQKIAHIEGGSGIQLIELNALLDRYAANEADRAYTRDL
ncbi:helix-turn-helix domain-containing protein [Kutzneria kofuensis]